MVVCINIKNSNKHKKNNTLNEFEKEGLKHFNFLKNGTNDGKSYGLKQFSINFDDKNYFKRENNKKNIAIFPGSNWEYIAFSQGLTNMNNEIDYNEVKKLLPKNVIPAYDGLSFLI